MTDVGRIVDSLARADEIMHRDCREKIAALEAELAAWREDGEWAIAGCGSTDCAVYVRLAELLGRKL